MNPAEAAPAKSGPQAANLLDNAYAASKMVYDVYDKKPLAPGWTDVTPGANSETGKCFKQAEAVELKDPNGQHYVAFRGTQTLNDVGQDIDQGEGKHSAKYEAAAKIGDDYRGKNVVWAGHSLGGGLAQTAAAVASERPSGDPTPRPAVCVTFNSAHVTDMTMLRSGVDPNNVKSHLVEVVNEHDPLNRAILGGKLHAGSAEVITERTGPNDVVIVASGKGGYSGSGHLIANMDGPDGKLTTALHDANNLQVKKAEFDRLMPGRDAIANTQDVVKTLEQARGQELQVDRAGHGGR
jgi:predicted heme/steroid binding protein